MLDGVFVMPILLRKSTAPCPFSFHILPGTCTWPVRKQEPAWMNCKS